MYMIWLYYQAGGVWAHTPHHTPFHRQKRRKEGCAHALSALLVHDAPLSKILAGYNAHIEQYGKPINCKYSYSAIKYKTYNLVNII